MVESCLILLPVCQKHFTGNKVKILVWRFVAIRFLLLGVTCKLVML